MSEWTVVNFGKYQGKTLPQILFTDPDWFFYMCDDQKVFEKSMLNKEARILRYRATHIKIPNNEKHTLAAEYYIHPIAHGFDNLKIVESDRPAHVGASSTIRLGYIDMSMPKQIKSYDKTGGKLLLYEVKEHIFGSSSYRMTKQKCESFFSDPNNFMTRRI